ncbi:MAG TPA: hypothetical protein VIF57_02580, partial [Polyangia bacterium]
MNRFTTRGGFTLLAAAAALTGCAVEAPASHGECTVDTALTCDTILAGNPDAGAGAAGLVGYSCTGVARPDENAKYVAGIPYGMICALQGPNADGTTGYCCTPPDPPVTCALDITSVTAISNDPSRACPTADNYKFECYGADRPEALNPALTCGNGIRDGQLVQYCCAAAGRPMGCTEAKGACPADRATGLIMYSGPPGAVQSGLTGWSCPADTAPRGEDFGMSESRADYYYFTCAVPAPPVGQFSNFCCFTPAPVLPGGSCVTATKVQGQIPKCTPGRFGFACYGRDTPEDDFTQIYCEDAPIDGYDDQGKQAKLFCCDYRKPNGVACDRGDICQSHNCTEGYCCAAAGRPMGCTEA